MVSLVEKYRPTQPPADLERIGDFLRDELERIAEHMAARDEVVCGTADFSASTVSTVTFVRAQPDTQYHVVLGGRANLTFWVSNRAVTGFDVNASSSTSGACAWAVFRDRDND